jgi:hypothetical protein
LSTPRVRPRFQIEAASDPDALMEKVRERLATCPDCTGVSVGRHAELFVADEVRRVWSPWLSITAERRSEGSMLRGRFAPHPGIWTLYLFLAFGLGFALLVGTAWGYAQWAIERTPWALLSLPVVLLLGSGLYFASIVGQRLGAEQMDQLRVTLEWLISDD